MPAAPEGGALLPAGRGGRSAALLGAAAAAGAAALAAGALLWYRRRSRSGLRISRLFVYPIKSCRAVEVRASALTADGLEHDREFCIVKVQEEDGSGRGRRAVALTQRETPRMALLEPELPSAADGALLVRKEGMPPLRVVPPKQQPPAAAAAAGLTVSCPSWKDEVEGGEDMGEDAADWFCNALGEANLRLLRFRGFRAAPEPNKYGEGSAKFSDGFSVLVTSEASLRELARLSGLDDVAGRMRPNIVVEGCGVHEEDLWTKLTWRRGSDAAELRLPKPCARCTIPRVHPRTGIPGADPMKTLKLYRSGKVLVSQETPHKGHYEGRSGEIFFGQNANTHVQGSAVLKVGDRLDAAR